MNLNISDELKVQMSMALKYHKAGSVDQAIPIYKKVLELYPDFVDANHLLGVALHESGHLEKAFGFLTKAIKAVPDRSSYHNNLGNLLKDMGRVDEAIDSFRNSTLIDPEYANGHINIGNIMNELGRYDESQVHLEKALRLKPNSPEVHNNLGLMFHEGKKQLEAAASSFQRALSIRPNYPEAYYNLANVLFEQLRLEDAAKTFQKALDLRPDYTDALNNLGNVFIELNRLERAISCFQKAVEIRPNDAKLCCSLGNALLIAGRVDDAFNTLRNAIKFETSDANSWAAWAKSMESFSFFSVDEALFEDMSVLLDQIVVSPKSLSTPYIRALRKHTVFSEVLHIINSCDVELNALHLPVVEKLSKIPLLLKLMGLCSLDDSEIERAFTSLRNLLIDQVLDEKIYESCLPFVAALANQCFNNEYIYYETPDEKNKVCALEKKICSFLDAGNPIHGMWLVCLASYRSLLSFSWATKLMKVEFSPVIQEVINRQVIEPIDESELCLKLPRLTPIRARVSVVVREQYEESPYPRWIKMGIRETGLSVIEVLRSSGFLRNYSEIDFPKKPEILVAGCGTGQHSISTATRFANSKVTAIDLSLSSLGYAARKTREFGVSNIEYFQGDILELSSMKRKFDIIECVGVLHHLEEPLLGWKVLLDLLSNNGLMLIGLYSEIARRSITMARDLIADKAYLPTHEGIRNCRQEMMNMKNDENLFATILNYSDFYSFSDCRDLLFHVQEQRFNIPQIQRALCDFGLEFLGFEIHNQSILSEFRKINPERETLASLQAWHEFEQINQDTFIGMYQFWCSKC